MTEYPGYTLPEGWTWKMVEESRARWDINPRFVPLVSTVAGMPVTAWGVPMPSDKCMED